MQLHEVKSRNQKINWRVAIKIDEEGGWMKNGEDRHLQRKGLPGLRFSLQRIRKSLSNLLNQQDHLLNVLNKIAGCF